MPASPLPLSCVELFAGLGGMAVGLSAAGFDHKLVVERDPAAAATLRDNLDTGHWPLFDRDIRELEYGSLVSPIDLLAAGVPCQPFSQGGVHAGPADDRNMFPETFAAIRALRPNAVLIENVRGLARPRFTEFLSYVLRHLETPQIAIHPGETWPDHSRRLRVTQGQGGDLGPRYAVQWAPVCVANYGVAQRRVRVVIVAVLEELAERWVWPRPTHGSDELLVDKREGSYWAEHGRPAIDVTLAPTTERRLARIPRPAALARWRTIRDVTRDLPEPAKADEAPWLWGHQFWPGARIYRGHGGSHLDEPSKTIKAGVHGVAGGEHIVHLDDGSYRYLSVRECMRIQNLPDHLVIDAPRSSAMRQIGNAVPPRLAEVFGLAIRRAIGDRSYWPQADYALEQDKAAGGYRSRQIQIGDETLVARVRLRNRYGYLHFSRAVDNPIYLGQVAGDTRAEMLADAWHSAHTTYGHLFPAFEPGCNLALAG